MPLLCPFQFPFGCWCRATRTAHCVVIWFPPDSVLPLGFADWLRSNGGSLRASTPCELCLGVLLTAPAWVLSALRSTIPQPPAHGSRTPGNLLPW